ncbi:hypothetical protein [Henriciella aquimarina]|uniref:hypothetical protein n=1 Tax=Henriciella aquimarina TaxID=545261 RepID=UPI001179E6ED|nr:hypothetical protein [Henriciella aquimarina]
MLIRRLRLAAAILCVPIATGACQTATGREAAVLENVDETTLSRVKAVLADAVDRPRIRLGPEDLSSSTTISVMPALPGKKTRHSSALPAVFDILTNGNSCFAVRRESGESYRLRDIACKPAAI